MADSILTDGFIRQRRNLFCVSLLLWFTLAAGVELTKLNIFGNEITIADPHAVTKVLWIAWGYLFYRYYVYFRGFEFHGLSNEYRSKLHTRNKKVLEKIAKDVLNIKGEAYFYYCGSNKWTGKIKCENADNKTEETSEIHIRGVRLKWQQVGAYLGAFFHTRHFTEKYFPFLIGCIPLLSLICIKNQINVPFLSNIPE